ncbi:rna polymerase sigma factor : : Sigma70_r2: Sigma70_r4 [Gemmata massiliana]|uniref:Rna polymerase sigma factor:: Sigma70_r2: Sigma70_r4 n=1 Tax=Gemmata massiliana TaxID=1210884 RepID=A0A6P2DLS5_9BACT|nr:sigma-70 family RNA polymerase sigma factor [Gemmata massiliana]VTS03839.1 rna polymerase sigma factor : : Sigma70_r2: Sigma70_r4 [Gemmata massiliana]
MIRTPVIALVENYYALACKCAYHWARKHPHLVEEFLSDAGVALWEAAQKFDPATARSSFATWVHRSVNWACRRRLQTERRTNRAAFLSQARTVEVEGDKLSTLDLVTDHRPREVGWELEEADEVRALMDEAELSERYRNVVTRLVGRGEPVRALAQEMGITRARVHQLVRNAVAKMKAVAEERDGSAVA